MTESRTYLPAAGRDWLLPLYDPIVKLLGGEAARKVLIDQAALRAGHHILEIGCGTGTLTTQIKRLHPDVEVVGLDPDPKALARAKRKAIRASVGIQFDPGFADELPYQEASFDRVFSCFMFHHLPADDRDKHCVRHGAFSNAAANFTCSILKDRRTAREASWRACFIPAIV